MRVIVIGGYAPSLISFRGPLLAAMVARGHDVTAWAADGTAAIRDRLAALGVSFEDLPLERAGTSAATDARTLANLTRRLRRHRPDLVFAYTLKPVMYGGLAARLAGVPHQFAMLTGLGYSFLGQEHWRRRVLRRAVAAGCRVALADAEGLFVQNPDDLADLRAAGAVPRGLPTTIVRGSGVDTETWRPVALPAGPLTFLFVGRLLREKGFLDFVEMARRVRARHPEIRFQAVGWLDPNPASIDARELSRWVADGTIEYLGEVPDVRPNLARAHVLVLPSYREGTPRSVLEAMSMGRPVIVTDVPGCRETIVDGEHGYLVPARDPGALAEAAARLIAAPAKIAELGVRARARIEALYDARAVADQMVATMRL